MTAKQMRTWAVVLTGVGSLMAALDTLVVSSALSTIRRDLGASLQQLEWTVNAYNLTFAVLLITGAPRSATASGAGACTPPGWRCSPRLGGVRARADRRLADRRARRPGRRARRSSSRSASRC